MPGPIDNLRPIPPGDTISGRLPPVAAPVIGHGTKPGEAGVVGVSDQFEGVHGVSHSPGHAGVFGHNDGGNVGVWGESTRGEGVRGVSHSAHGAVVGVNDKDDGRGDAAWFESTAGEGCHGVSHSPGHAGVFGYNDGGNVGVWGESTRGEGVRGVSHSAHGAVVGVNDKGDGRGDAAWFESTAGEGCHGVSHSPDFGGVFGYNDGGSAGVWGESTKFDGVFGMSHSPDHAGVSGHNDQGGPAGWFGGNVIVTGDIQLTGADLAEHFEVGDPIKKEISADISVEPGTVMVLGEEDVLFPSRCAYDKRVVGVLSGAGDYKPGIVLDKQQSQGNRKPIALLGKVFCKVDAQYGAIEVGDLLTTSPTPGHGMKADDPMKAFGAVIGKALRPLHEGQGLIPILIALQ